MPCKKKSMTASDNSLVGGLLVASMLVALNYLVGYSTYRSKKLETLLEGRPQILIHDGKLYEDIKQSRF